MQNRVWILALALAACEDQPTEPPKDTMPPVVEIMALADDDQDGDGLVDMRLTWRTGEDVDISKTVVRTLGGPATSQNLLTAWRMETLADTAVVIHETLEQMLPFGDVRLLVEVRDSTGNVTTDTVQLDLAAGKLIKTLVTERKPIGGQRAYDIAICDGVGYMPAGPYMVVFDPDSLKILADVRNPETLSELKQLVCTDDGTIYVTEPLFRFDRRTRQWIGRVPGTFGADAIVAANDNSNLLYIGERDGAIATFDRSTQRRIGRITGTSSEFQDYVFAIAVTPNNAKLYFTRTYEGGILVLDPRSGQITARIHLGGNSPYGASHDMVLSADGGRLFIAVRDGLPRGIAIVDTETDVIKEMIDLHEYVPQGVALSPSGKRLFVTTQDRSPELPSDNVLIDLRTRSVAQQFARTRISERFDNRIVFHPNGKLIFAVRNMEIDVYLNRE